MNWLSLRNILLKFKTFKRIADPFRGLNGINLKLMKESRKITTRDWLGLETPLGSRLIMHAQKPPWKLDAGHVDILEEGKLLYWPRLNQTCWDLIGITTGSYSVLKLSVELHSKLTATPFMVFSITLYSRWHNIITSYARLCCVSTNIK